MADPSTDKVTQMDNSGHGLLRVPGFGGIPIYYELNSENRFAHGSNDWRQVPAVTARELAMVALMNSLTDKRSWHLKVFDDEIVAKWREEAFTTMPLVSPNAWTWCLAELRDKAVLFNDTQFVRVLDTGSCICKSDSLVPKSLGIELRAGVAPLLALPEKDWHPNSDEKVLNLVHPSLFPLVYGRSLVLEDGGQVVLDNVLGSCGLGRVAQKDLDKRKHALEVQQQVELERERPLLAVPDAREKELYRWSTNFQWLPCEVEFTKDIGTDVGITSYINNLHPVHFKSLYRTIEKLLSLVIKPWNACLIKGKQGPVPLRIRTYGVQWENGFPEWARTIWKVKERTPESMRLAKEYLELPDYGSDSPGELPPNWQEDPYTNVREKWMRICHFVHPEPGTAFSYEDWVAGRNGEAIIDMADPEKKSNDSSGRSSPSEDSVQSEERSPSPKGFVPNNSDHEFYSISLQDAFRRQGLQVIVKLAGVELTPENPSYPGGNWHLEGLLNEHIVATAIYYYSVENVTETRISFRQETFMDEKFYHYGDTGYGDNLDALAQILGTQWEDFTRVLPLQNLGAITTPQGRLITWPNTLQHCVEPFELIDPSVPGHRRFIVLWLVDPNYRVCSTRNVPPPQHNWWAEGTNKTLASSKRVPQEVADLITKGTGNWPIGIEEAKTIRLELMKERTWAERAIDERMEYLNFCEH